MGKRGFRVDVQPPASAELDALRAFDRRRVKQAMVTHLTRNPTEVTRNKKPLPGVTPRFEHHPPVWELRVGDFRVFYDVGADQLVVFVRALRHKPPGKTTEEIIR